MNDLNRFARVRKGSKKPIQTNNAVIYTRVSTKEQADNNFSLDTQRKACEEYATKSGYLIQGYFGGTYESAKNDERKEFNRMLDFVRTAREKISYILVYTLDRFSRSGVNGAFISNSLMEQGIKVIAVTQYADADTPSGKLHQNMLYMFAEFDNALRRDKTIAGMKDALRRGEWVAGVPVGYDSVVVNGQKSIVPNETAEHIRKAFQMKAAGTPNIEIVQYLRPYLPHVYPQKLDWILRNPFYCGLMSHGVLGDEVVKGRHEPIITRELFIKANNLPDPRRGHTKTFEDEFLPLRRHVSCAECGRPMTGYLVKKKWLYYYKCNSKACASNRSADKMHEEYKQLLYTLTLESKVIEPLIIMYRSIFAELNEDSLTEKKQAQKSLKEIQVKIDKVEERFILGEIERGMYDKFKLKYEGEKREFADVVSRTDLNPSNLDNSIKKVVDLAIKLPHAWEKGGFEEKQKLQRLVFPEGVRYDRKNTTYLTTKVNSFFSLTASFSGSWNDIKKEERAIFALKSNLVTPTCQISNFLEDFKRVAELAEEVV